MKTNDIKVVYHGNVFMVYPLTSIAKKWIKDNVEIESWQWLGNGFGVDQHYIDNLLNDMVNAGLNVK